METRIEEQPNKDSPTVAADEEEEEPPTKKDWRFWTVFLSCCLLAFLISLDGTVVAISLPYIANHLHIASSYVWVINSFWIAGTVFQPLCAQLADTFGRKTPLLISLAIFFVGGCVAGSATSGASLIAGRTVQGLGSGGVMLLMEVVVCDIISLRERGRYLSIVLSMAAFGAVVGPPVGGAIAQRDWRWVFYINLPISGAVFLIMVFFMRLKYVKSPTWGVALARIDFVGSLIFVASITSLLVGLVFGGTLFPWNSWHVIVPIVLGVLGWAGFHVYETATAANPAVPRYLFENRTSVAGFLMVFIYSTLTTWVAFAWPLYFQGILGTSPLKAGINYLAFEAFLIPSAGISGSLLTKLGRYKPFQFAGFSLLTLGCGLNIMLSSETRTVIWVVFIAINAIGLGLVLTTMLPAILASLPEADVAKATGMYSFLRSFGFIWGATIPAIIFNTSFDRYAHKISDDLVRNRLGRGNAYQYVSGEYVRTLPPRVQAEVVDVYTDSLKVAWEVAVAFAVCGVLLVFVERHVTLREKLDTKYGLAEKKSREERDVEI